MIQWEVKQFRSSEKSFQAQWETKNSRKVNENIFIVQGKNGLET